MIVQIKKNYNSFEKKLCQITHIIILYGTWMYASFKVTIYSVHGICLLWQCLSNAHALDTTTCLMVLPTLYKQSACRGFAWQCFQTSTHYDAATMLDGLCPLYTNRMCMRFVWQCFQTPMYYYDITAMLNGLSPLCEFLYKLTESAHGVCVAVPF